MKSTPTATAIRIIVVLLHFGIYAAAAILLLGIYLIGSADVRGPLNPSDWNWVQGTLVVTIVLSIPTAIFLSTRKSAALLTAAVVPALLTLCFIGFAQTRKIQTAAAMNDSVVTSPATVAGQTLPAGSHLRLADRGRHYITLAPGGMYDGLPIVGEFEVDDNGVPLAPVRIAHDVTVGTVACSASAPVTVGKTGVVGCTLAANSSIDGVPCAAHTVANFRGLVGRRADCTTWRSTKFVGLDWPAGTHLDFNPSKMDENDRVMDLYSVTVGSGAPPQIRLFGKPLPHGAQVLFEDDGSVVVELGAGKGYCQMADTAAKTCTARPYLPMISTQDFNRNGKRFAQ